MVGQTIKGKVETFVNTGDVSLRDEVVEFIWGLNEDGSSELLKAILLSDRDDVVATGAWMLSEFGEQSPEFLECVPRLLDFQPGQIHLDTANYVRLIGTPTALSLLFTNAYPQNEKLNWKWIETMWFADGHVLGEALREANVDIDEWKPDGPSLKRGIELSEKLKQMAPFSVEPLYPAESETLEVLEKQHVKWVKRMNSDVYRRFKM